MAAMRDESGLGEMIDSVHRLLTRIQPHKAGRFAQALASRGVDLDEIKIEKAAADQLFSELNNDILRAEDAKTDGIQDSPLYTKLPTEIRLHIFSYLVTCEDNIHLHPVKGNTKLGFRLSRCERDGMLNMETGSCNCERGYNFRGQNNAPPAYLDTELMLVSRTVRREALDLLFTTNHFTFTSLRDLNSFTECFGRTAPKLQHIKILERCSDGCHMSFHINQVADTRKKIGHLQSLELHLYLEHFSLFGKSITTTPIYNPRQSTILTISTETPYPDGFLEPILPLYFSGPANPSFSPSPTSSATTSGTSPSASNTTSSDMAPPPPPTIHAHIAPSSLTICVRPTRFFDDDTTKLGTTADYVKAKLEDVFRGRWAEKKDVPMGERPKRRVPESERAPVVKRGLLCLGD
jgi:hypothetical protein